jgi:hypothetical protein
MKTDLGKRLLEMHVEETGAGWYTLPFFNLLNVYLMSLSIAQSMQRRIITQALNNELEKVWTEATGLN